MSEEIKVEEIQQVNSAFWDEINWDNIGFNKIKKDEFMRIRAINKKIYATFLGSQDQLQFYLFKPLSWGKYKDIRTKNLSKDSTHEYIINECVLWPKMDTVGLMGLDAGVMLTLVNQVLAVSNFIKDPDKALEMILEVPE